MSLPAGTFRGGRSTAVVIVLVVTAGCLGGIGVSDSGDGTGTTPGNTAGTTDGNGTNGTTTTGGTVTGDGPAPAVTPPFDAAAISEAHRAALREAGSVTVRRRSALRLVAQPGGRSSTTVARMNLESGEKLVRRNGSAATVTTYVAPDGTPYQRRVNTGGAVDIYPPDLATPPNTTRLLVPPLLRSMDQADVDYAGRSSHAGVEGYVYRIEGPDAVSDRTLDSTNVTREDLHAYSVALVLSAHGRIKYAGLSMNVTREEGTFLINYSARYVALGATSVTEPDWVAEAKAEAAKPDPDDVVTRRFSVDAPDGRVDAYVTAKRDSLDRVDGPEVNGNPVYRTDFLNQSRVGGLVRVYWLSAEDLRRVRIVFHYREEEVPGGNESQLRVVWDRNVGDSFLNPLNSTVDPTNDTVTLTITDPERLEKLQGQAMMVLQYRHYVETLENRRIRPGLRRAGAR